MTAHCRFLLAILLLLAAPLRLLAEEPPDVKELIQRVIERSRKVSDNAHDYSYQKETWIDEFDSDGKWKERRRKKYEVILIAGIPYPRLLEVNGKPITGPDLERERKREEEFKRLRKRPSRGIERQDMYLTDELASRFIFKLQGSSSVNKRPAWLITFHPREGLKDEAIVDRFINRMAGQIWVDKEDHEISSVKIRLQERASLWGGFLGSLDHFTLTLFRVRLDDGMWLNSSSEVLIQARKLFSSTHLQVNEMSTNFKKSPAPATGEN